MSESLRALVRNYSHDENVDDFNFYIPYQIKQNSWVLGDAYKFKGLSQSFSFKMANFKDVERTCYIEYIGFFPTLDAALDYEEEYESVKSDTEVALGGYTGETVSYYDGNTEEAAQATAERLIDELLLEDAYPIKKLNDVEIAITTQSHTAPVKDTSDGIYTFKATITYKDQEIYTLDSCTLTISQSAEEQVYLFTNPDFVATIDGAQPSEDYAYMQLGDEVTQFALDVSNRNISLKNYPRISLGVTEATGPVTMKVNDETVTLYNDTETIKDTELSVVFTETGYTVYKDAEESTTETLSTNSMDTVFDSIRFGVGAEGAKIRYLVFDTDASVDAVFDDTVPDVLTNIADITDESCHAGDASTRAKAVARAKGLVVAQAGSEVSVAKATLRTYQAATTTETGTYSCDVLIFYGEKRATYYKAVNVSGTIALQPADPIFIDNETFVNNNRYTQNLNVSLGDDGCIHTETISASVEDSFFLFYNGDLTNSELYLPDYPYISVKFKRTGAEAGETGDTQIYFWSDANKGNPSLNCSFGGADILDEWVTAIIDTNEKTVTLYDMDDEKINTTRTIDGSLGQYIGYMEYMRLTMARNIKADRTADIEYVGFFSTMEAAKDYMDGLFIDDYTKFTGNECAVLDQVIESEALTVELAARVDASSTDVVRPLISNKGDETESYFALEVTTEGTVQLTCGSQVVATTTESIADGKWTYITASVDKDSAKIYLDGELAAEGESDIQVDAIKAGTLVVGGDHLTNSTPYIGDMANLKLYSEVAEPSNYEMPETMTDGMIAGWTLDAITTAGDFVGYESSTYTLKFNNELSRNGHEFIGSDCLISAQEITAAPQTFAGWMNIARKQLSGTYSLISTSGMKVQLVNGQIVAFYNDTEVLRTTDLELVPGMWTHVAATFDATNSTVTIYVNGESVVTREAAIDTSSVTLGKVYIGATDADTDLFVGMLSDIRLWSNVRTDIAADTMGTLNTDDGDLLGAWDVWTHDNLNYKDASSNCNIAKLTSDSWYKLEGRETPAYSIVHIGDTQNSTGYNGEPKFQAMFDWIAENVDTMNMVYLTHAGDVTQTSTEAQWKEARKGFDKIEGKLPYGIAMGNHDYAAPSHGMGTERRDDRLYNQYFPYQNYATRGEMFGAFENGSSTNIYNLINVDWDEDGIIDEKYIFFSLEYGPRDEVVDWVCKALTEYSDRKAILTTHCYFETNGSYEIKDAHAGGYEFKDANEGFDLWNKILYEYPNVVMLTCGHSQGQAAYQQVNKNKEGNNVIQILADPSAYNGFPSVDTIADGILTLNLANNTIADATNKITIKAGTYHGTIDERELLLTLEDDFICYQDGKDGMAYELLGSTELVPGYQYNTEAADGGLYVTGDDYTELLPVQPAGGWQTKLDPINNNSGIFVKSADGTEARIDSKDLLYYVNSKTQYYCNMNGVIQSGDILTIKGQFRVIGQWDAMYQDSHIVINIQESKYQYVDGIWMWLSAPQATVTVQGGDDTNILLNSSIPFERIGIADNGTVVDTAKIRAMAHAECGVFVNDVKQEGAYLLQTSEQELQIVIDTDVEHGDKITIKGAFYQNENTDQCVQQVVHYAETSFWYCVDVVSDSTEDGITSGWYEATVGTYKIKGDINADGEVDVCDIVRIKRWYAYGGAKVPVKNTTLNSTISHLSSEADMVAELSDMILTADLVMPIMASNGPMVHGYKSLNENVPENFLTDYYFQMIVNAGINTISVTENDYASTAHEQEGIKTGLEMSEKFGLGYYLTDSQVIGSLNYNTEVDAEALATRIQEYSHYKSFQGLVGVDEPNSEDYQLDYDVEKRVSGYGNLMTALRTLNVDDTTCLYPCYDNTLMDGYKKYVNEYCEVFRPNLLRYDNYPFERDGMNPLNLYFWNMSVIRQNAKNCNIPFGVTIQAGGQWVEDTDKYVETVTPLYPNEGQFKWNVNTCLAFGTKAISYFTLLQPYHFSNALDADDNEYQDFRRSGLIGMDGIKNQWYDYAKDCNEQIAAIDSVLMASESKGVIATGNASTDMELITSDNSVSDCVLSTGAYKELKEVDGDALIGYFDYQGKTALYVVNYKMDSEQKITLTFEHEVYDINRITMIKDAVKSVEEENLETIELEMEAGEGILLVI